MVAHGNAAGHPWVHRLRTARTPGCRLVCFPPEGASATFFLQLAQSIARPVEVLGVQYPGRRDRRHEPPVTSVTELADRVSAELDRTDLPIALLGHGLGAAVAFETAVRVERAGHRPLALFASGAPSPSRLGTPAYLDTGEFTQPTRSPAPTPLTTLRDDQRATETYRWHPANRVSCHILAMVGDTDPAAPHAPAWREVTSGWFELQLFAGGHGYLTSFVSTVANTVSERITTLCPG
ncbi:thioesterase II family protein [Actinokineospora globicatena]|uniref:thioesterase II family protein n=1 Tax=Actinokineospora globicatena TaxID=103729 RepID=UPI0020A3CE7D|nr:thioesterase domain-containing protein [Actinokineospora globicatena]MCP2302290.1 Surfactin synthase thioesterase subunit [Actinokineospora globicatena]GLW76043.1 thioesterase [Actinokineospora globicatena]GLW82879.1 thioesterase [Actinokineospora globicatena]